MAVTAQMVAERIGTKADNPAVAASLAEAVDLVDDYLDEHQGEKAVPPSIYDRAVLDTAEEQYQRARATFGIVTEAFAAGDEMTAVPMRISRDPLASARATLAPWCPPTGFA